MAGARGLWRATGIKDEDCGKLIIAVVVASARRVWDLIAQEQQELA